MAYPERGANYDHNPKFIERMKRAEGGDVSLTPQPEMGPPLTNQQAAMPNALGQIGTEPKSARANEIDPQTGRTYGADNH